MKNVATGVLCSVIFALTACGGGGSSGSKPKNNSSAAVVSSKAALSSAAVVSSATAVSSTAALSSAATVSSSAGVSSGAASSVTSAVASSNPGVGGGSSVANSQGASSVPVSSVASSQVASSVPASSAASSQEASSTPASSVPASSVPTSSAASSSTSSVAPVGLTGVFIDSAVAGVSYTTSPGGFTGVTSATGQYQFAEGDTVVFSIGAIEFPPVTAKGVVTPVDMVPSGDTTNQTVVNIAVLLQSLDSDGDASNGISIPAAAVAAATQTVDFTQSYASFTAAVLPVVQHTDTSKAVVTESAATNHLEESLTKVNADSLAGTWHIEGDTYKYTLFILDSSHYAAIDHDASVGNGSAFETGNYEWNQETGVVTLTNVEKTESGLDAEPPMANGNVLSIDGNTMTLIDGDETFELHRLVASAEHPLNGGWSVREEATETEPGSLVVFAFTDTHYMMGQQAVAEDDGTAQTGIEIGTYSYNLETEAIVPNAVVDTNGQWGLSHSCALLSDAEHSIYEQSNYLNCGPEGRAIIQTIEVTGDTLTFISEADTIANGGEEDPFTLERVNGVPDGDVHLKLELTLTLETFQKGQLYEVVENGQLVASMQCSRSEDPEFIKTITPGYVEHYNEAWVLGSTAARPTWIASIPATFNPTTGAIALDVDEPLKAIPGHSGFFERWETTFNGIYQSGSDNVIEGDLTEVNHLSWNRDDRVSTCTATYSVVGKLRPVSEQLPPP